ncbi:MAG: shikimate dehydrogenase [Bacteroidetes bacterium]|nr:MAG: shikimate dehydrogenase [Bacteroidota bacterium]
MTRVTHRYGLIGYPLGHSFSGRYFARKFEREGLPHCAYELFPLPDIAQLPALLEAHPDLRGLNVTIPHKEAVLRFAEAGEEAVRQLGAANTIVVLPERLLAFNTDVYGFEQSLMRWLAEAGVGDVRALQALVLGTGGAAKAVAFVLRKLGIGYRMVSRSPQKGDLTYAQLTPVLLARHRLVVNTTPVGMAPHTDALPPVPVEAFGESHLVYDLVYNPERTRLLQEAEKRGARVKNGLEMLYLQAERSWAIWERFHPVRRAPAK